MPTPNQPDPSGGNVSGGPQPSPHRRGYFSDLLDYFKRWSHPTALDSDGDIDSTKSPMADWFQQQFSISSNRTERYRIFEEMESFGLVKTVLSIYAEEATQPDYDRQRSMWIESSHEHMVKAGNECLRNLQAEDRVGSLTYKLCQMGDQFRRLVYHAGKGVLGWKYAPPGQVHRLDDKYDRLVGFKEDGKTFRQRKHPVSWPWDYTHFRLFGPDDHTGYGTAALAPLFRPWRMLTVTEDAILIGRLRRAPGRLAYFIQTGNLEESEAMAVLQQWKKRIRKHEYVSPDVPAYKKQVNIITPTDDIFLALRGKDDNSRVDEVGGQGSVDEAYDMQFWINEFCGVSRIPKAYLGWEGEISARSTLLQQDVRFARVIKNIRRAVIYGYRTTMDIHFSLLGEKFNIKENPYVLQMSPISYLDEYERLELIQLRFQIIEAMAAVGSQLNFDPVVWASYIMLNYGKIPEEIVLRLLGNSGQGQNVTPGGQVSDAAIPSALGERIAASARKAGVNLRSVVGRMDGNGYTQLNEAEKKMIFTIMSTNPAMARTVGNLVEYTMDERAAAQTEPSTLPPTKGGSLIRDMVEDEPEAKILMEDIDRIGGL